MVQNAFNAVNSLFIELGWWEFQAFGPYFEKKDFYTHPIFSIYVGASYKIEFFAQFPILGPWHFFTESP